MAIACNPLCGTTMEARATEMPHILNGPDSNCSVGRNCRFSPHLRIMHGYFNSASRRGPRYGMICIRALDRQMPGHVRNSLNAQMQVIDFYLGSRGNCKP